MSMLSRQSPRASRRAQLLAWPLNSAARRAASMHAPGQRNETTPTETPSQSKGRIIFSGIQPTGVPHLGNYLGALRQWVKLQDEGSLEDQRFFSIVDLHAITVPQDPQALLQRTRETYASLVAIGLDPTKNSIFVQSHVPQHAQLMWLLSCHASMGYLGRMTQWKSKAGMSDDADPLDSTPNKPALKLGLFSYPVLQAADVLLYHATHVPVGEDQAQHLEFTRELAGTLNHVYASSSSASSSFKPFPLPQTFHSPAKRVMSLQDPTKKMSKSDPDPRSRILVTDSRDQIAAKIKVALTDSVPGVSYDRASRPGVSNLIDIMYYMDESAYGSPEAIAKDMAGRGASLKALKQEVAKSVADVLEPVRERYEVEMSRPRGDVEAERRRAVEVATGVATQNLETLMVAMGMRGEVS